VLLIGLLVAVAGCAAPARSEKMVAEVATPAPATLRERVAVTDVTSSKNSDVESDKLRQAVEMSLQKAGYLNANPAAATMLLAVALISLERGDIGVATTSRIRYSLTSRARRPERSGGSVTSETSRSRRTRRSFSPHSPTVYASTAMSRARTGPSSFDSRTAAKRATRSSSVNCSTRTRNSG